MKKILAILIGSVLTLSMLASCKDDYANKMFKLYLKEPGRVVTSNADIIPLGQYEEYDVACFHEKHDDEDRILISIDFFVGPYQFSRPCPTTVIMVYSSSSNELVYLENAYDLGWITDDILLHIIYEFDQASEKLSFHNWHKSEEFVWDLERYRKKS